MVTLFKQYIEEKKLSHLIINKVPIAHITKTYNSSEHKDLGLVFSIHFHSLVSNSLCLFNKKNIQFTATIRHITL